MSEKTVPRIVNPADLEPRIGSTVYPVGLREICDGREKRALGDIFGLTQFGVNLTTLPPGAASAQRHWHEKEDEFVYVLSGELTLVSAAGETPVRAGECAGFPAGKADGHMVVNRGSEPATFLEIGTRSSDDITHYPDVDLHAEKTDGTFHFTRKDGTPV